MRRLLLAILIAVCGVLLQPIPADAGGPTSVLITNPSLDRATALTTGDTRYGELEQLLNDTTPVAEPATFPDGDWLVVSWLAHDIHVWRTHQVLLDAAGGPLVAMTNRDGSEPDPRPTWARLDDAAALKALLTELGILGKSKPDCPSVAESGAAGLTTNKQPPTAAVETAAEPESSWFALTGWRWVVPGLLGGLLLGLAFLPARKLISRRSGPPGERHQLIDVPGH
ncbi:hypothetical protein [Nocardioides speluncae]|uniref:hypothetical protein n=1 Tax=Nocardioides speluncae TaxID=2670337 RepID=UPI000D69B2E3|nr:hypothetical protein [Nocardioides speluncae]